MMVLSPRGRTSQGGSVMPRKSSRTLQATLIQQLQKQVWKWHSMSVNQFSHWLEQILHMILAKRPRRYAFNTPYKQHIYTVLEIIKRLLCVAWKSYILILFTIFHYTIYIFTLPSPMMHRTLHVERNYPNKKRLLSYRNCSTGCHIPHGLLSGGLALHQQYCGPENHQLFVRIIRTPFVDWTIKAGLAAARIVVVSTWVTGSSYHSIHRIKPTRTPIGVGNRVSL